MSQSKKNNTAEDIMASLMAELKLVDKNDESADEKTTVKSEDSENTENIEIGEESDFGLLDLNFGEPAFSNSEAPAVETPAEIAVEETSELDATNAFEIKLVENIESEEVQPIPEIVIPMDSSDKTVALVSEEKSDPGFADNDERTVAVAGYSNRHHQKEDNDIKISVGQSGAGSSGYGGWGSTDSNLAQAENLKIAQSKILDLEKENEKLRLQNEELVSASEILKERSDLLTAQVYEYKNDRGDLESSFKNEIALLRNQLNRKDSELQKAQMKIEELESRLKFDMKKIRVRERELENRLELIRAEKNALVRNKDEQILDARRKIDQLQLEVDSFRQKCVELNRALEVNQDSFKRTTRALRLAMANLELQEENKTPLKKVD